MSNAQDDLNVAFTRRSFLSDATGAAVGVAFLRIEVACQQAKPVTQIKESLIAKELDTFNQELVAQDKFSGAVLMYGWFLMSQGRFDEAAVEMDKAKELDPSSITIEVGRGRLYYFSRDYEKARLHFEKLIELQPDDTSLRYSLYTILEQQQKYPEAFEAHLNMFLKYGGTPDRAEVLREAFFQDRRMAGLSREAVQKARGDQARVSPWFYANQYTRMGRKEEAFMWLEKSFDQGEMGNLQLKIDPLYDGLQDDPRYVQLLARIGLTP